MAEATKKFLEEYDPSRYKNDLLFGDDENDLLGVDEEDLLQGNHDYLLGDENVLLRNVEIKVKEEMDIEENNAEISPTGISEHQMRKYFEEHVKIIIAFLANATTRPFNICIRKVLWLE